MTAGSAPAARDFLRCATPAAWLEAAAGDIELLLQDHATLELKAAQQAQMLIWKYGSAAGDGNATGAGKSGGFRARLLHRMSRLAREELRHFEQVLEILGRRGVEYRPVSASRYAAALHSNVRTDEPQKLIDRLLAGAIIEARSCERFESLVPVLDRGEPELAKFYSSLLRSEGRHYRDYIELAEAAAETAGIGTAILENRLDLLLDCDRNLIESPDAELRFHSGVPDGTST